MTILNKPDDTHQKTGKKPRKMVMLSPILKAVNLIIAHD